MEGPIDRGETGGPANVIRPEVVLTRFRVRDRFPDVLVRSSAAPKAWKKESRSLAKATATGRETKMLRSKTQSREEASPSRRSVTRESLLEGGMKTRGVSRVILPIFLQSALDTTMARGACPETVSGLRVTD